MAPSNSGPRPVFTVVGENAFHMIVSQMFVAINSEIPEPRPYPFCRSSSSKMTIRAATTSCKIRSKHTPAPNSLGGPYMPVSTYTVAWPSEIMRANTGVSELMHTHVSVRRQTVRGLP